MMFTIMGRGSPISPSTPGTAATSLCNPCATFQRDEIENTNFMCRATWGEAVLWHRQPSDAMSPCQSTCQNQQRSVYVFDSSFSFVLAFLYRCILDLEWHSDKQRHFPNNTAEKHSKSNSFCSITVYHCSINYSIQVTEDTGSVLASMTGNK